jgi:hypothetical protein
MAQLPSGRHVAIQATPLFALMDRTLERAMEGGVITRFLRIERVEHLSPYIDVMYFRWQPGAKPVDVAPGGLSLPPGLEPYASGCTLATIGPELAGWSEADRSAFTAYLAEDRTRTHLAALLDKVMEVKEAIAREGEFETRWQALTWKENCHPVQNREESDPLFDVLEDPYDPNARDSL